ncbi:hypothetical protein GUITHDRAFT_113189 [Guillardia theta CCMP2712]|uniref:N-acetyltransferase domain-containing protein n=1 Tax=Guillardia theta (strain CCMP2712) TaxID=905079 RepID=L1IXU2_GUITC|nr:hypothetical protein GUITHDRAFT_113189 [Guillardia theta CCMP2712]EKX40655.1 hypothetical protein GUITHDRAFT_113189 [Guillardia theta CCMP2712]|eukprot:XP_005827635.1 hypothetical protein GUITHDRAFT_113189 [Guillardia theta CCMP2712]
MFGARKKGCAEQWNKTLKELDSVDTHISFLSQNDYQEVIEVCTAAFVGTDRSPGEGKVRWIFGPENVTGKPQECERFVQGTRWYATWCTNCCFDYGCVLGYRDADSGKLLGVALIMPPGTVKNGNVLTVLRMMNLGWKARGPPLERNTKRYGKFAKERALRAQRMMERMHRTHAAGRHWYVYMLGAHPDAQGKGVGSSLLMTVIKLSKRNGVCTYLECHADKKAFYEKYMKCVEEKVVSNADPNGIDMCACSMIA